jgi:hypothetical protein
MRVYIIHYHLHTGGVTRIIQSQIQALTDFTRPSIPYKLIIGAKSGKQPSGIQAEKVMVNPIFNYLDSDTSLKELEQIRKEMERYLRRHISKNDIIHVHNLNLGKNPVLYAAGDFRRLRASPQGGVVSFFSRLLLCCA